MKWLARALVLAIVLLGPVASAQDIQPTGGSSFDGGTVTTPIVLPDGTISAPALAFTNAATMGIWKNGSILALQSGAPTATTGASVAGRGFTLKAGAAVASTDTAGAAAGGSGTIAAGDAARFTSGNAAGGDLTLLSGAGIGTGLGGTVVIGRSGVSDAGLKIVGTGTGDAYLSSYYGTLVFANSKAMTNPVGIDPTNGLQLNSASPIKWSSTTANALLTPDTGLARSAAGVVKVTDGSTGIRGYLGGGTAVASATAMPLPTGNVFHVTGTTNITSITATNLQSGVVITLIFDGVLNFTDGSNLKLASTMATTADDTITLAYDGTNFYEIGRSVN